MANSTINEPVPARGIYRPPAATAPSAYTVTCRECGADVNVEVTKALVRPVLSALAFAGLRWSSATLLHRPFFEALRTVWQQVADEMQPANGQKEDDI